MSSRNALEIAALLALSACAKQPAARPQWLVSVATDAPVPSLGQELLVDVFDSTSDASSADTRLFDASRKTAWPVSFGVLPGPSGQVPRIRVRLYRLDQLGVDGLPQGTLFIDATAVLPLLGEGVTNVALTLSMACFGVPPDVANARTCDPLTGKPGPEPTLTPGVDATALPAPGSWQPGVSVPCDGAPSGMACVPGGAFIIGATQFLATSGPNDPTPEHLVTLGPFAIDEDELTVGAYRALVVAQGLSPPLTTEPGGFTPNECTYLGAEDAKNDALPVTCVTWDQASKACGLLGKRLPTEAEWEYVAGNLGVKTPFPWAGDPTDVCDYAVVSRGRVQYDEPDECLVAGNTLVPVGPAAGGSSLDVTALGVRNLGGNVSEWVADVFDSYSGPCWTGAIPLVNPLCTAAVAGSSDHAARGASWQLEQILAHGFYRGDAPSALPAVGFRCAMDR